MVIAIGLMITGTLLSPVFLGALTPSWAEWQRLSDIGQAYGAASSILSALALIAIGISISLQVKEMRLARSAALRAHHMQLMQIYIENPALHGAFGIPKNGLDRRLSIYLNLVLTFWEVLYTVDGMTDDTLAEYARHDLFSTEAGRRYWASTRDHRLAVAESKAYADFVHVIDKVWRECGGPVRSGGAAARSRPHHGRLAVTAAVAGGVAWWAFRSVKGRAKG